MTLSREVVSNCTTELYVIEYDLRILACVNLTIDSTICNGCLSVNVQHWQSHSLTTEVDIHTLLQLIVRCIFDVALEEDISSSICESSSKLLPSINKCSTLNHYNILINLYSKLVVVLTGVVVYITPQTAVVISKVGSSRVYDIKSTVDTTLRVNRDSSLVGLWVRRCECTSVNLEIELARTLVVQYNSLTASCKCRFANIYLRTALTIVEQSVAIETARCSYIELTLVDISLINIQTKTTTLYNAILHIELISVMNKCECRLVVGQTSRNLEGNALKSKSSTWDISTLRKIYNNTCARTNNKSLWQNFNLTCINTACREIVLTCCEKDISTKCKSAYETSLVCSILVNCSLTCATLVSYI